jgi:ABC-type transporter Mla MlaB component
VNSWISGQASGDFPLFAFPGASGARVIQHGEGASAPAGDEWLPRVPRRDCASPFQATFTTSPPVLQLAGDIDEWTYPSLTQVLARASQAGERRIQVDLLDVRYCDVAGLRAILSLASGKGHGRGAIDQIVLAPLPGFLHQLLRILGWDATPGVILEGCVC